MLRFVCSAAPNIEPTQLSMSEFIQQYRQDAMGYTALHSIGLGRKWPNLGFHIERLRNNLIHLYPDYLADMPATDGLGKLVKATLRNLINEAPQDFKVVLWLLFDVHTRTAALYLYADAVLNIDLRVPVKVAIYGHPRASPQVKNFSWVHQRASIEARKPPGTTEMILMQDGKLFEGLVTNFWVVRQHPTTLEHYLETAPFDCVLQGSLAVAVADLAASLGVSVEYRCPTIESLADWKG
ncbi:hypothetical protein HDU91_003744, partial [Kappamyces sp. JEL0680]